ncbi:MAG: hemerythrin domain-containing protein [Elusimicrobiota bacterium]
METTVIEGIAATDVLRQEHQSIKDLMRQFEDATTDRQKKSIGDAALRLIEVYTMLQEELFYPAVRRSVGERQRVVQALAALQVAKLLIKELKGLSGGEHYNARFNILKENIVQHVDEAERDILPRLENAKMDLQQLAQQMIELKGRVKQRLSQRFDGRTFAAVAAGATVIGVAAFLINQFRNSRNA